MNQLKQYLRVFRWRSSPDTDALQLQLDSLRQANATANEVLEKAQEELQRAREGDTQLLAELQRQLGQLESERAKGREQLEGMERVLADAQKRQKSTEVHVDSLRAKVEEQHAGTRDQLANVQRMLADAEQLQKSEVGRVDSLETKLREEVSSAHHQVADVQGWLADAERDRKATEGRVDALHTNFEDERSRTREQLAHAERMLAEGEHYRKSIDGRMDSLQTKLNEEHSTARQQVERVQRILADSEQRQKSADADIVLLESKLDEERSRHAASQEATAATLARIQDEQRSLLAQQSELSKSTQAIDTRLQAVQQVANARSRQSRLMPAVVAALLLAGGVLGSVFMVRSQQERGQELAALERDVRDMRESIQERIDNQDAALNDLTLALNRQLAEGPPATGEVSPAQTVETQVPDEQLPDSETFTPDIRELQAGLIELGYDLGIPKPNGDLGVKTRQALLEFRHFYLTDRDANDEFVSEPLAALILKSADTVRADAARFNINRGALAAIRLGSIRTGVDFSFLMELAGIESNFNPAARAPRSSATGLFQFRDRGWLAAIRTFGADYGLQAYATRVGPVDDGAYEQEGILRDPLQLKVLALRLNPRLSTLMMAEDIKRNLQILSESTGREPNRTDLYLAHFLGSDGAVVFLSKLAEDPAAIAADLFPQEAERNPSVFRDQRHQLRTLAEVYGRFERKFNTARYMSDFP